jgi:hypothetical protein
MKALSVLASIAIALAVVPAKAQQAASASPAPPRLTPALEAARQGQLDTALHQRVSAAGGKLVETQDAKTSNLSKDLPSLISRSDEVVLAHVLTSYGGVSLSGDRVQSHYDVQVLRTWKGPHAAGDVIRFFVPAGGLPFSDGSQAERRVHGFASLRNGGRYVLFLRSTAGDGQSAPGLWLAGDGVQGAFLLSEERVQPAYRQGPLWRTYNQQAVPEFLTELDADLARP